MSVSLGAEGEETNPGLGAGETREEDTEDVAVPGGGFGNLPSSDVTIGQEPAGAGASTYGITGNKITGHCVCRETEFQATPPPKLSSYCHCVICQKSDANFFSTHAHFDMDRVDYTRKQHLKEYKVTEPTEEDILFCGNCGTKVGARWAKKNQVKVPLTLFDTLEDESLLPTCHIFVKTRNPKFLVPADGLPKYLEYTDGPTIVQALHPDAFLEGLPAPAAGGTGDPLKRARVEASQEDIAGVGVTATGAL